jgi:methionyl-tRNA formyltransferase
VRIIFFGTPGFAVPALEALYAQEGMTVAAVVTQPDKPSGRGAKVRPPPIKALAFRHDTPVFQPRSLRKEFLDLRHSLLASGPFDIGVVIAFGQILPKDVLDLPLHGCINIHASLLPRWRGAAPIQRAIQAGDQETGVCLMQMEEGLDTGSVFSCERTPIHSTETGGSLHDRLARLGADLLIRDLHSIVDGNLHSVAQSQDGVTYASKITTEDCRIDWALPANVIARSVRAFSPSPGCFSFLRDKRVKILGARAVPARHTTSPGTIVTTSPERFEVSCGEGVLQIDELQLEGKKRVSSEEFLRGMALSAGEKLLPVL